jgi:hypothetical protein
MDRVHTPISRVKWNGQMERDCVKRIQATSFKANDPRSEDVTIRIHHAPHGIQEAEDELRKQAQGRS